MVTRTPEARTSPPTNSTPNSTLSSATKSAMKTAPSATKSAMKTAPAPSSTISPEIIALIVVGCIVLIIITGVVCYRYGKSLGLRRSRPPARSSKSTKKVILKFSTKRIQQIIHFPCHTGHTFCMPYISVVCLNGIKINQLRFFPPLGVVELGKSHCCVCPNSRKVMHKDNGREQRFRLPAMDYHMRRLLRLSE